MKKIITLIIFQESILLSMMVIALMLTACSNESDEVLSQNQVQEADPEVTFDVIMGEKMQPTTRTPANVIESVIDLKNAGGFGVFGCYTGLYKYLDSNVHPDFMYNEHLTSTDGSIWTYSPVKYWPNGEGTTYASIITGENPHYVSFMAYAPYSNNITTSPATNPAGYCIPSFSHQGEIGNPWLTYQLIPQANLDKQVDLLYAEPELDRKKLKLGEKVIFKFKHALACVGDRVTIVCSDEFKDQINSRATSLGLAAAKVVVKSLSIKYTLTSKARQTLWNTGDANWTLISSGTPTCTRYVNIIDSETDVYHNTNPDLIKTIWDKGVYYIPMEQTGYPQTAQLFITYCTATTTDGTNWSYSRDISGTASIVMKEFTEAYKPGKHLYINVILGPADITFTCAIAPWDDQNTSDISVGL